MTFLELLEYGVVPPENINNCSCPEARAMNPSTAMNDSKLECILGGLTCTQLNMNWTELKPASFEDT